MLTASWYKTPASNELRTVGLLA